MALCFNCILLGYCRNKNTVVVSDLELQNPEFIRDVREFCYERNISSHFWQVYLTDLYRDYQGRIITSDGREYYMHMDVFEIPSIRDWFRDFCSTPCPPHITPRIHTNTRKRVRVLATIIKAHHPRAAMMWGVRPANDNVPPEKFLE